MQTAPILQQLNGRASSPLMAMLPKIKQLKQTLQAVNNPQALLNQLMSQNPQLAQLVNMANGDYNQVINSICRSKGIDPQEFYEALKEAF